MRQIKFRVWYEKPEWERDGKSQYVPKGAFVHSVYVEKPIADDVYTYEQFTGLLDKNGKEIYEGDIIRHGETYRIIFANGGFTVTNMDSKFCYPASNDFLKVFADESEVIGNVHESKHLLDNTDTKV
jgi:uncharacterized phage protein (TIGR01671 family)